MDAGCYTIHLQRTVAGAEPWHDGGVEPLRPQLGIASSFAQTPRRAVEHIPRQRSTYASQLWAFTGAILWREPMLTGPDDAVANMSVIDACYAAAGLPRREPSR